MNFDFLQPGIGRINLSSALQSIQDAELVRQLFDEELVYLFKHALTQDATYSTMMKLERKRLHRMVAETLESTNEDRLDAIATVLAQHYAQAGENEKAFRFLMQYAESARRMSAFPEAIDTFERALTLLPKKAVADRSNVYLRLGDTYCRSANFGKANENFDAALALATQSADARTAANALSGSARVAGLLGEHARARELGEKALLSAREANSPEALARTHRQLGISYNYDGENGLAESHLQAALELYRQLGDADGIGSTLNSLGIIARDGQDLDRAWAYIHSALELSQVQGDKYSTGVRLNNLGDIAEQRGDFEGATHYQEQAQALALEIGDREGAALTALNLGLLALKLGELSRARTHFHHALAETLALDTLPLTVYVVAAYSSLELKKGHPERAANLLGLALEHPSGTADIKIDFAQVLTELEIKLGADGFNTALSQGKALNVQQTVQEILTGQDAE